jgi:hypothetical protein
VENIIQILVRSKEETMGSAITIKNNDKNSAPATIESLNEYFETKQSAMRRWAKGVLFRKNALSYDENAITAMISELYLQCTQLNFYDVEKVMYNYGSRLADKEIGIVQYMELGQVRRALRTDHSLDAPIASGDGTVTLAHVISDGNEKTIRRENGMFLAQITEQMVRELNRINGDDNGGMIMEMFYAVRGDEISIEHAEAFYELNWTSVKRQVQSVSKRLKFDTLYGVGNGAGESRTNKQLGKDRAAARRESAARLAEQHKTRAQIEAAERAKREELSSAAVSVTGDQLEELKKLYDPAYRLAAEAAAAAKVAAEMTVEVVEPVTETVEVPVEMPANKTPAKIIPLFQASVSQADSDPLMNVLRETSPVQGFLFTPGSGFGEHNSKTLVVYTARQKPAGNQAKNRRPVPDLPAEQMFLTFPEKNDLPRNRRRNARTVIGSGRSRPANQDYGSLLVAA